MASVAFPSGKCHIFHTASRQVSWESHWHPSDPPLRGFIWQHNKYKHKMSGPLCKYTLFVFITFVFFSDIFNGSRLQCETGSISMNSFSQKVIFLKFQHSTIWVFLQVFPENGVNRKSWNTYKNIISLELLHCFYYHFRHLGFCNVFCNGNTATVFNIAHSV